MPRGARARAKPPWSSLIMSTVPIYPRIGCGVAAKWTASRYRRRIGSIGALCCGAFRVRALSSRVFGRVLLPVRRGGWSPRSGRYFQLGFTPRVAGLAVSRKPVSKRWMTFGQQYSW